MDIKLKIGVRIKELRTALGLSQEAFAFKAGIDRTYVSDVENGRRNISAELLEKVITALELSFAEFFSTKEFKK
ncbi:MAG: helix-turn-helix transcriptional regulator [Cytophagales bacterium]|nr:helix-turn-helix transcriptional regulator [Cytophaga sp.]